MLDRTDDEILAFVARAYFELGESAFTVRSYQRWRRETIDREDEPIPTLKQLIQRYGSMTEALHRAVPDTPRRRNRLASPMRAKLDGAATRRPVAYADVGSALGADVECDRAIDGAALQPLIAMAQVLTPRELREFEQAARRRLMRLRSVSAAERVERLRPLALLLLRSQDRARSGTSTVMRREYEALRQPEWPSSDRLVRAYGSWPAACRAAAGVLGDGRRTRVGTLADRNPRGPRPPAYTRAEVIAAVRRCAEEVGRSPSSHSYNNWARARRKAALGMGQRLRLPHHGAVTKLFPRTTGATSWDAVISAAFPDDAALRGRI